MLLHLIVILILAGSGLVLIARKRRLRVIGWLLMAAAVGVAVFLYNAVMDAL
jgi:multisubunit Na+/H+ antiporter MnhC subunit